MACSQPEDPHVTRGLPTLRPSSCPRSAPGMPMFGGSRSRRRLPGRTRQSFTQRGAIVGDLLAPSKALATLPISVFVVGMAACTLPAGAIARRHGRRAAFLTGTGMRRARRAAGFPCGRAGLVPAVLRGDVLRGCLCRRGPLVSLRRRRLRPIGATPKNWLEAHRYLNMEDLKEHKKDQLREAA